MRYQFTVTYGETLATSGSVVGHEATRVEAERQASYYCGYYRGQGHRILAVELVRLRSKGPDDVLELPMQIAMWIA